MQKQSILKGKFFNPSRKTFGLFLVSIQHKTKEVKTQVILGESSFINLFDMSTQDNYPFIIKTMTDFLLNGEAGLEKSIQLKNFLTKHSNSLLKYRSIETSIHRIELIIKTHLKTFFGFPLQLKVSVDSNSTYQLEEVDILVSASDSLEQKNELSMRRSYNIDFSKKIANFTPSLSVGGKTIKSLKPEDLIFCQLTNIASLEKNPDISKSDIKDLDLVDEENNPKKVLLSIKEIVWTENSATILLSVSQSFVGVIENVDSELKIETSIPEVKAPPPEEIIADKIVLPEKPSFLTQFLEKHPLLITTLQLLPFVVIILFILMILL